ncbi:MAG: BON domain-containing protein [Candidatus Rokuibacteriota bacterium]
MTAGGGPHSRTTLAPLAGVALGVGLMYVLDPIAGRRRRAMARHQLRSAGRQLSDMTSCALRDARNRSLGLWAETRARLRPESVTGEVLEERIRSELGSVLRYPGLVEVEAKNGVVSLTGAVPADETRRMMRHVRRIRGVSQIDNRLDVYRHPSDLPGVQPPVLPPRSGRQFELMQRSWSPAARALVGGFGAASLLAAARRGPATGMAMAAVGALALLRAVSNEPLVTRARTGSGDGDR